MEDKALYHYEVNLRNKIMSDIRTGKKITKEERLWLVTHRLYNRKLGYPYLNADIIHLEPKRKYQLSVEVISSSYNNLIIPIISVPGGLGKILTSSELRNIDGQIVPNKPVKLLALTLDMNKKRKSELQYQSQLGLLEISFMCDYFDDKQNLHMRMSSTTDTYNFAMLSEIISPKKILYRCKAPGVNDFGSLVFTVEWN